MKKLITLFGILSLVVVSPIIAQAGPVGKFTSVEGRVDNTRPGRAAVEVKVGDEVYEKDIIRTKSKSKAEIAFFNGNSLRLAQSTRVEITECITGEEQNSSILRLFRGKIQSKVKKLLARIVTKRQGVITAFEKAGFSQLTVLKNYVKDVQSQQYADIALLVRELQPATI